MPCTNLSRVFYAEVRRIESAIDRCGGCGGGGGGDGCGGGGGGGGGGVGGVGGGGGGGGGSGGGGEGGGGCGGGGVGDGCGAGGGGCGGGVGGEANGTVKELVFPKALDLDRPKRARTTFSPYQLFELEREFQRNQYLVGKDRSELAKRLRLSKTQVVQH
ncbi:uncharacterized protein LOC132725124 [Ruditapes philippinarum]|uniref:uncharacterized protein LOC132725124 n=1 Tax=Ruditapes philippinarum TaxID=129788 RepID=UPI00295ACC2F|nr:uncharacterized protein LOC132725124 [Ruditapes philippinarum]